MMQRKSAEPLTGVTELLLDTRPISWEYNLARRLNPPVRHPQPILEPESPWEESYVTIYGSVLPRKGGGFRMWYMSGAGGMQAQQMMCYAESDDGFTWKRVLNQKTPFQGHSPTNIVMGPDVNVHGPCVIENQHDGDPSRQYLALFDSYPQYRPELKDVLQESRWTYAAWSADGFTWSPDKGHPAVAGKSDVGQSCVWDAVNRSTSRTFGARAARASPAEASMASITPSGMFALPLPPILCIGPNRSKFSVATRSMETRITRRTSSA